jgi:hypothetical protein
MRRIAMPNVEVNCTVSNCYFHRKGNICGAEKILIDTDSDSKDKSSEFASEVDFREIEERAKSSEETCCKTFRPKK